MIKTKVQYAVEQVMDSLWVAIIGLNNILNINGILGFCLTSQVPHSFNDDAD